MGTYHSAADLAAAQSRKFGLVRRAFRLRKKEQAEKTAKFMLEMVSGGISSKELARRGHPFGRGRTRYTFTLITHGGQKQKYRSRKKLPPIVPTPMLPINKQTGRLARSLRIIPEQGGSSYRVQFTAPHAKYALGPTRKVVDRGYRQAVHSYASRLNRQTTYDMRLDALKIYYGT